MREFRVVIQPEAERNIGAIVSWLSDRSPAGAIRWHHALRKAIERLRVQAETLPLAPESRHFDVEVRELLFKTRRGLPYRILFTVSGTQAHILYLRAPGPGFAWQRLLTKPGWCRSVDGESRPSRTA